MPIAPRVRFAPSPTGELHLGGARTALFNYLFARQKGGQFFLRIEDTDVQRSKSEFVDQIRYSLEWLGLNWDEPIVYQSRRRDAHHDAVRRLLKDGGAYRCFCTVEELAKERDEAAKSKKLYRYSSRCRNISDEELKQRLNRADPFCLRLLIPNGKTKFTDAVYGPIEVDHKEIDDFIIQRTDGTPTYNFTVVVDDLEMEINWVIRGEDHLANTPKQIIVYKALGSKPPKFSHLPMILGPNGQRLSKRHGATGVQEYRDMGVLPEGLLNYLALLGWSPGNDREVLGFSELIKEFSLKKVIKKGAVFDEKKLNWICGQHLSGKESRDLLASLRSLDQEWHKDENQDYLLKVIEMVKPRAKSLSELDQYSDYFFTDPTSFDEKPVRKRWKDHSVTELMNRYWLSLHDLINWDAATLEEHLRTFSESEEISAGKLIHPTRIAISGQGVGPSLFELMALIGRDRVLRRLNYAIDNLPPS
ncbi:MAG: glutamate--tRNA ligase [Candidatus Neomarinimicrobiota bacterium]|nr:glutamate--tRNA ligase [Candidatus Neomarinimicrobiota bacterium]